jgi:membrane protein DedA with SNARE-associated domain
MFCIFVPVWRHLTAIVAGTSKMPFWEFMVCAYSGTFLWVSAFISLGYWGDRVFGHAFKETAKRMHLFSNMHSILLVLSILLGAGMLLYVIWKNGRDAKKAAMAAALAGHCGKAEPGERSDSAGPAGPGPLPPGKQ